MDGLADKEQAQPNESTDMEHKQERPSDCPSEEYNETIKHVRPSPSTGSVVFEEAPKERRLFILYPKSDGVVNARHTVDDVERCEEAQLFLFAQTLGGRILIGHPPGVHGIHIDAIFGVSGRRGVSHHVERGLGHVGMRVKDRFVATELPFHGRNVDDEAALEGRVD